MISCLMLITTTKEQHNTSQQHGYQKHPRDNNEGEIPAIYNAQPAIPAKLNMNDTELEANHSYSISTFNHSSVTKVGLMENGAGPGAAGVRRVDVVGSEISMIDDKWGLR